MTENNLSEKLFKQKDGKLFAYADEIKKAVKKLKEEPEDFQYKVINYEPKNLDVWGKKIKYPKKYSWKDIEFAINLKLEQIDKIFGKELI